MLIKIIKASRPATLVVAILSTSLGIIVAYRQGYIFKDCLWDIWRMFLVTVAALLLQSAINMMNNYFEDEVEEGLQKLRNSKFLGYKRSEDEILTFKVGILFFIVSALIGLYLSFYSGKQLLFIELIGIFAAYGYAGEPFNYKKYGLGVVMSFIMMGPLMAYASFYIFSKNFSVQPIVYSFTSGLFIPAILLANELRDYEEDKSRDIGTLTVRIGYRQGIMLYHSLVVLAYINTMVLVIVKCLPPLSIVVLLTIPLINKTIQHIKSDKKKLVPSTAKLYLIFTLGLFLALIFTR